MKIKIAVPELSITDDLLLNQEEVKQKYDVEIFKVPELKCLELFRNNRVDAALLSPLGYSSGVLKADYRIVPVSCLVALDYTGLVSIYFKEGTTKIDSIAMQEPEEFAMNIGKILLAERYNIEPKVLKTKLQSHSDIQKADVSILWETEGSDYGISLDLTEDWYDTYEFPLPLFFWVCKAEEHPENIAEIVKELFFGLAAERSIFAEDLGEGFGREGKILYKWSEEIEHCLFETLQLLYFHQYIKEIPAVKLLGRD